MLAKFRDDWEQISRLQRALRFLRGMLSDSLSLSLLKVTVCNTQLKRGMRCPYAEGHWCVEKVVHVIPAVPGEIRQLQCNLHFDVP